VGGATDSTLRCRRKAIAVITAPISLNHPWRVASRAPSTAQMRGPPPPYRGGGEASNIVLAMRPHHGTPFSRTAPRTQRGERSAARRTTGYRTLRCGARQKGRARLAALHCGIPKVLTPSARSGPRFLESPDANGRTLSGASAASTSQSDHAPDGTMPRPPASKVTSPAHGNRTRSINRLSPVDAPR
jgi:hypothetical protein